MVSNTHQYSPFLTKNPQLATERYSQVIHNPGASGNGPLVERLERYKGSEEFAH
jgi:hypothetical protein